MGRPRAKIITYNVNPCFDGNLITIKTDYNEEIKRCETLKRFAWKPSESVFETKAYKEELTESEKRLVLDAIKRLPNMYNKGCLERRKLGVCKCNMYNADGSINKRIKRQIENFFKNVGSRHCPCVKEDIRTEDHVCRN